MLNIDKFLEYLCSELSRSPRTVESYRDDLIHFERFAKGLSDSFSWETVDSDMVRNWMESMMDKGNSAATVERRLSALKTFYRFALTRHYVESDPVYSIKGPKKEKPLPQFVKESEMDELLDRQAWGDDYNNVRARTIIITFYETGMRLSELVISFFNAIKSSTISCCTKGSKALVISSQTRISGFSTSALAMAAR